MKRKRRLYGICSAIGFEVVAALDVGLEVEALDEGGNGRGVGY